METVFNFDSTKELLQDSDIFYIICTGNDGNYNYINNHYASKFSYVNSDFVGQPYYISMHPDDMKVCEEAAGKCYANPGKHFPATIRKHDGQGGYVYTQWEFTLMVENREPTGVFCLGYDITEFVKVKSDAVIMTNDLKAKIGLLGAIAFEQSYLVKAPLARIMSLISVLKELDRNPDAAGISSVIHLLGKSTDQLNEVISDIVNKTGL